MKSNVKKLPSSDNYQPEQAIASALKDANEFEKVIIIADYRDGSNGIYLGSSKMTCAEALWMVKCAERYIFN